MTEFNEEAFKADGGRWFLIDYECECGHEWQEGWSCACDSECPQCGAKNVEAKAWVEDELAVAEHLGLELVDARDLKVGDKVVVLVQATGDDDEDREVTHPAGSLGAVFSVDRYPLPQGLAIGVSFEGGVTNVFDAADTPMYPFAKPPEPENTMTTTEAKRRAKAAYAQRQREAGTKRMTFDLGPRALAALASLTVVHGSQAKALEAALIQTEGLRRYGLTDHQLVYLREQET